VLGQPQVGGEQIRDDCISQYLDSAAEQKLIADRQSKLTKVSEEVPFISPERVLEHQNHFSIRDNENRSLTL